MDRGAAEEVPVYENNQNTDGRNGQTDQVSPRRAVKSLQSASEQSGVAATELYDFDADSAAFSSASEAANKDGHEDAAYRDGLPAQRGARSASGVARVADALDFNTFTMETAAEDALATAAEYKKLDAEGVLREDRDTAEYLRNAATAALGHVQNAQAFGLMTVEEGYGYEQSLQSVIDGTQEYLIDNAMREGKAAENRKGGIGNAENLNDGTQRAEGVGADREGGAVPQGAAVAAKRGRNDSVEIRRAVGAGEFDQRSARSLGIENGSQAATMQVLREDVVDRIASLRSIREEAAKDGAKVVFFTGKCEVATKRGRYQSVEGVYDAERNTFYIKADGISRDARKVFRHEAWHKRVAENRAVLLDAAELLGKKYGTAELDRLVAQYCDAYYGIYGVIDASMSEDEATDIYMKYLEEICADAYAQIRRGGINIAKAEAAMETYRTDTQKQTAAATERTNGPGQQGKYSVNNEFEAAIDQWTADGSPDGMSFILGSTGDVLQGLGAIESDIYMQGDKIKTILRKHLEMSMDEIKKIPQILDDPVLILKSRNTGRNSSQNTRLVVFGTVKAQSGKPVLSVLDLRPSEGRMLIDDMQKVNSAYVKGNDPVGFVRRSEVLYADKKRTNQLLRWIGFQAPTELLRHGSMGSIAYEGNDVKIFGKDFSEVVHEAATAEDYTGDATTANSSKGERQKYSFGGEKARSANIEALREAQEMQARGVDMESIRKATGWHEGMDGKWRFEIDDSGMTYHRGGDAAFRRYHADYAEYQELMRKWASGDVTAEEEARLQRLDEIWGREDGRLRARVESGSARLEDILDHEGLFQAYPQLRWTRVEFSDLPKGTLGSYSPSEDLITLSSELRSAPESTLVHEIQHAIQNTEGLAKGSSWQYWEKKLTRGDEIQSKGFQDARRRLIRFQIDEANEEALTLKDRLEKAEAQDDDLAEYNRLWEEAERRGLDGKINEYYELRDNYYMQMNRPGNRVPSELYYNTAGEIEARDAAARRALTAEQRREKAPDYGSADTVFADGGESYSIGKTTGNKPFVEVEQDILAGVPEADWAKTVKENLKQKFPSGITVGNNEIHIDKQSRREMTFSRYMQRLYNTDPQLRVDKLRATNNADEILQATTDWVNEGLNHPRKDNIRDFARGEVLLRVGGNDYTADVVVGTRENGSMLMYDILNLQPTSFTEKETDAAITVNPSPGVGRNTASISAESVAQNAPSVKQKYSLEDDTKELDAGYRRAVEKDAAENEPTGGDEGLLPEKKRGGTDYAELATEEIERRAKEATLSELRNMVKSTDTRLNQLRWGQRNGILTQELRKQMKTVEETAKIQNEELRKRNKEERAAREQKKIEDAKKQVPRIAKKELKTELTELFHTAPGMRQTANDLIERTANRLLQQGYISSEDRAELRDKLFDAGVVNYPLVSVAG